MKLFRLYGILLIFVMALVLLFFDSAAGFQRGQLVVDSIPSHARVLINGEFYGHTPMKVRLHPDEYRLQLEKKGYAPYRKRIRIHGRTRLKIIPKLEPRELYGMLLVRSHPPKAAIFVDGRYYGETPERITLKKGRHDIRLEKEKFEPYRESVSIRYNQRADIKAELQPVQRFGGLDIDSHPAGAQVLINGEYYDRTPMKTKLRPGKYRVELRKRGYKPLIREVEIRRGKVSTGDFKLKKRLPRPRMGQLKLYSDPENAQVVVQNRDYGKTPVEVRLPEGNYRVVIKKKGYLPYERDVHVSHRDVDYIHAKLEKKRDRHGFGKIHVSSDPRGAKVFVDGEYRGEAPLSVRVAAGEHRVKVKMRGYEPYRQRVFMKPWGDDYVEAELVHGTSGPATGTLKVVSKPLYSKVFIDGNYAGKTPLEMELEPNIYSLEVSSRGRLTFRQPVHIKPGQISHIKTQLPWAGNLPPKPHEVVEKLKKIIEEKW